MKYLMTFAASLLSLFCTLNACPKDNAVERKMYIAPEQLQLSAEGIAINCDNQWFGTDALFSDEKGLYIQTLYPQEDGCRDGYVPCRNCDRCVKYYYDICPHCSRPV